MTEREKEKDRARRQAASGKGPSLSAADADPDKDEFNGYAECYPGMVEMNDAVDDSDEEADYTKMDLVSDHT